MSESPTIPLRSDLLQLLATRPAFWRWSDDATWVEWADGQTIAHRDELLAVIVRMTPRGLPSLDAILLVLAATRSHWSIDRAEFVTRVYAADPITPGIVDVVVGRRLKSDVADTFAKLHSVADLPAKLRDSPAAKASLADFIFESGRTISADTAEQMAIELRRGPDADFLRGRSASDALQRLAHVLRTLNDNLDRVDGDVVDLWQRTGIDFDVEAADVDVPPAKQARQLLRLLRDDAALGGLANVATDVLAAVHVPRTLSPDHDSPGGGVSDVSNHGDLDRLLLSELAHDDLTLAVRVAMNEALYLRHEPPVRHPPVGRLVVIDNGIRLWGTARLFAAAVALAMAAGADERAVLHVVRTGDDGPPEPVTLGTRAGLVNHLAALSAWPDPLPTVEAAVRSLDDAASGGGPVELVLVTHERTAADPHVLAALSTLADGRLSVRLATVTADGQFSFSNVAGGGRLELARAKLSAERLTKRPTKRAAEQDRDAGLPTILRLPRFPLLLPARPRESLLAYVRGHGVVGVSVDRRLMQWTAADRGAKELTDRVPPGVVQAVFADADRGTVAVVAGRTHWQDVSVLWHDLASGQSHTVSLGDFRFRSAVAFGGSILLLSADRVVVVSSDASEAGGYAVPLGLRHAIGRYYYDASRTSDVFAATTTGFVPLGVKRNGVCYFDHDTLGPIGMTASGRFEVIGGPQVIVVPDAMPVKVRPGSVTVAADGRRVAVQEMSSAEWVGIDLDSGRVTRWPTALGRKNAVVFLLGANAGAILGPLPSLQNRLPDIAVSAEGNLVLRPKHMAQQFVPDSDGVLRLFHRTAAEVRLLQSFRPVESPAGRALRLKRATWADGSSVWLDARGLLHLVSSDARLPQVTLTLPGGDPAVAGWVSTGNAFGPAFYTGSEMTVGADEVWNLMRRFATGLR